MAMDKGVRKSMHNSLAPQGVSEGSNNTSKGNTIGPLMSTSEQNKMAGKASGVGKDKRMS